MLKLPEALTVAKASHATHAAEESIIDKFCTELDGFGGSLTMFIGTPGAIVPGARAVYGAPEVGPAPGLQRFIVAMRQALLQKVKGRANTLVADYRLMVGTRLVLNAEVDNDVQALLGIPDADFDSSAVDKHLAKAQSPAARDFYALYKSTNAASPMCEPYLRRNVLCDTLVGQIDACTLAGSDIPKAVAMMTTVHALARPLRPSETREAVVAPCVSILKRQSINDEQQPMLNALPKSRAKLCIAASATPATVATVGISNRNGK